MNVTLIKATSVELPTTELFGIRVHVDADPGLHVVLGRNNSGKTHLLKGVQAGDLVAAGLDFSKLRVPDPQNFNKRINWDRYPLSVRWQRNLQRGPTGAPGPRIDWEFTPDLPPAVRQQLPQYFESVFLTWLKEELRSRPAEFLVTDRMFGAKGNLVNDTSKFDFQNLAGFLEDKRRSLDSREWFREVNEIFEWITEGLTIDFDGNRTNNEIHIVESGVARSLDVCGDGLRDLIVCTLFPRFYPNADLMLDEPGLRLHPHVQRRLLAYLAMEAKSRAIWMATQDGAIAGSPAVSYRYAIDRLSGTPPAVVTALATPSELRNFTLQLGWRPEDAFLSDVALLVEGESDELAFRVIVDHLSRTNPRLNGVSVIPVLGDGNFWDKDQKRLRLWIESLRKVAPHAKLCALIDRSGHDEPERSDLARAWKNLLDLSFLEREELENYFLDTTSLDRILRAEYARCITKTFTAAVELSSEADPQLGPGEKGSTYLENLFRKYKLGDYRKVMGVQAAFEGVDIDDINGLRCLTDEVKRVLKPHFLEDLPTPKLLAPQ